MAGMEWIVIVGVIVALLVGLAVVAVAAVLLFFFLRRGRAPAGPDRAEILRDLGYLPAGAGSWSRKFQGTAIVFTETKGWRWTIRLPRYNTLSVQIEERASGKVPDGRVFEADDSDFDGRFVMASELAAQAVALVTNHAVKKSLLTMPYVSLRLKGDELVLDDPELRSLGGAKPGSPEAVEAEREAHMSVAVLVNALFDSLYSRLTGTILPEHR
jgi:hypothetical protein